MSRARANPKLERDGSAARDRGVLYPTLYLWYILVSSLDLMLTNTMLNYFGGIEVNTIADWFIRVWGFWGLIGFKFATVVVVVGVCEFVGRRHPDLGRRIALWALVVSSLPSVAALAQVALAFL